MPSSRYQHGAVFVAGRLHISGGAVGGGRMVEDETVGVMLDTAAGCWCPLESQPAAADDWMRRCCLMATLLGHPQLHAIPASLPDFADQHFDHIHIRAPKRLGFVCRPRLNLPQLGVGAFSDPVCHKAVEFWCTIN